MGTYFATTTFSATAATLRGITRHAAITIQGLRARSIFGRHITAEHLRRKNECDEFTADLVTAELRRRRRLASRYSLPTSLGCRLDYRHFAT